jgi:HlyD family secretion protein
MGEISQPALQQLLEQERARLVQQKERVSNVGVVRNRSNEVELDGIARQRVSLEQLREAHARLEETLLERYESVRRLGEQGLAPHDAVIAARRAYLDNNLQLASIQVQVEQLNVREARLGQQDIEAESDAAVSIEEIERNIARYEAELKKGTEIVSSFDGRITELAAAVGQMLSVGERLGSMEIDDPHGELVALSFFDVADGKKLVPGMEIQVSPSTVQRERFGSVVGVIDRVSEFPVSTDAVSNTIGNREVAARITANGSRIEVYARTIRDERSPNGFKWTSGMGPERPVTAGTTLTARVTVERRRPITYVIPILRDWSGT